MTWCQKSAPKNFGLYTALFSMRSGKNKLKLSDFWGVSIIFCISLDA